MRTRRSQFSSNPMMREEGHRSVLLHEAIEALDIQHNDVVLDATLGGGGHAKAIVDLLGADGTFVGFDLDADAIERTKARIAEQKAAVHLIEANFKHLKDELASRGITGITKALFDLGWSSYQLDSGRGFSFLTDEPLVMTYSKSGGLINAATVVNTWQEESIADVIWGFGGERYARRIAKAIAERREKKPFTTSRELAEVVAGATPAGYHHGRTHPATKTFQALRIAVNDELGALSDGLQQAFEILKPKGRLAVITFHSLEDRAVKRLFAEFDRSGRGKKFTKKPIVPTLEELRENPRARSAKLRVVEKISHDKISQNKQI